MFFPVLDTDKAIVPAVDDINSLNWFNQTGPSCDGASDTEYTMMQEVACFCMLS